MKLKVLIALIIVLCVILITAYLTPSSEKIINRKTYIRTTVNSIDKFISKEANWSKWWPRSENQLSGIKTFKYKASVYKLKKVMFNSMDIDINYKNKIYNSVLTIFPATKDSVLLDWKLEAPKSNSVLKKIWSSETSTEIENNTDKILDAIKSFLEDNKKVYEIEISQIKVTDTILISTKFSSVRFPTNQLIYQKIEELKSYIIKQNAIQINPPMLHIKHADNLYQGMIALPINKTIAETQKFVIKRMVPGKILVCVVMGGVVKTKHAMQQLEMFMYDHKLSSPAISFESLITNRIEQPDSSKWVTKIYYPIY